MTTGLAAGLEPAWEAVVEGLEANAYSGAVMLVQQADQVLLHRAAGWAMCAPRRVSMVPDMIFDLASLTKVTATLPSILRLVDAGLARLDQPVGEILTEFGTHGPKARITLRRLLSHSSGLPAWRPLYLRARGHAAYLAAIAMEELAAPPDAQVIYSDLGFILLGHVVARVSGRSLPAFAGDLFGALGMTDTLFRPPAELYPRIAATERGNPTEREMVGPAGQSFAHWRREVVRGQVHDGNAYYGLGGVAGHAGLFSTAADLARYGRLWLRRGSWDGRQLIAPELIDEATCEQAPGRGLGWVLAKAGEGDEYFHGRGLSAAAFGHTGFTGTMLWIDPGRDLVVVLLTNRVHPELREDIRFVRPRVQSAIARAVPEISR